MSERTNLRSYCSHSAIVLLLLVSSPFCSALESKQDHIQLPSFGSEQGLISDQHAYRLGRAWLMSFRNQVNILDDPLVQDYLETLSYRLASHSELKQPQLELIIIDNPQLNAFAVPGGVIGVNAGLFQYAATEAQLASVLAHEIGHLSQQHFSRRLEQQKRSAPLTAAGMLAGILLSATAGGDAGMATIATTQAAALNQQLRYSRLHEQEADRVAMQTLVNAKLDPGSMADMFSQMLAKTRYMGDKIPEFLLTHPLTESRVNDSRSRARSYPVNVYTDNPEYQIIRTRLAILSHNNQDHTSQAYQQRVKESGKEHHVYGLVLALQQAGQFSKALQQLQRLLHSDREILAYSVTEAELLHALDRSTEAINLLTGKLQLVPYNYPISMQLSKLYMDTKQYTKAEHILNKQAARRANDPAVWYLLAEVRGFTNNVLGLHEARAEYFALNGQIRRAIKQLGYASQVAKTDYEKQRLTAHLNRYTAMEAALEAL